MSTQRISDTSISTSSGWSLSGAQHVNWAGNGFIAFGRAGSNAVGQTASYDFTAVSGEQYNGSGNFWSHNANNDTVWHHYTVRVVDNVTGAVLTSVDNAFDDGKSATTIFSFNGTHSGDLRVEVYVRFQTGNAASVDLIMDDLSIIGPDPATFPCFTKGTHINTQTGLRRVEDLRAGDFIEIQDGTFEPILWIGNRTVSAIGKRRPIRITAGALGNGLPIQDLIVSRQHRMLMMSPIAERIFGAREVLISAIKLTELPGIYIDDSFESVDYFHILFKKHEIIFSEGSPSESLYCGPEALKMLPEETMEEILFLFPEFNEFDFSPETAKLIPQNDMQRRFVAKLVKSHMSCP